MSVHYFDGMEEVLLGDWVEFRVFFRKQRGRVVYVPGISPVNPEFEYNGMRWAGVRLLDGALAQVVVKHTTGNLKRSISLLRHDSSPCEKVSPSSREFEESESGPFF